MKIVFISNYMNHHQISVSDRLRERLGKGNYYFIQTEKVEDERIKMGWLDSFERDYIIYSYETSFGEEIIKDLIESADCVVIGGCPNMKKYLEKRRKNGKLILRYSERHLKKTRISYFSPRRWKQILENVPGKQEYLLCASAYAPFDFNIYGFFWNKTYKWGYFPPLRRYSLEEVLERKKEKDTVDILWTGRFIDWKHPDDAISAFARLKSKNAKLTLIGTGPMRQAIENQILKENLSEKIAILDAMTPDEVRNKMEESDVFLFTSDYNEGWGAVLNEALNSGCAAIASHAAGSTPYLVEDGKNALIYKSGNVKSLSEKLQKVVDDKQYRIELGLNAINTVENEWNAVEAADRLICLSQKLLKNDKSDLFVNGPCSKAKLISQWGMYKKSIENKL